MHDNDEVVYYDSEEQAMDYGQYMSYSAAEANEMETLDTKPGGQRLVMDFGNIQGWMTKGKKGTDILIWLLLVIFEDKPRWRILGATR
jgi:hypothetical protein